MMPGLSTTAPLSDYADRVPRNLGAMIWLRADLGVVAGSTFIWGDQSAAGVHSASQSIAAQQPTRSIGANGRAQLLCGQTAYSRLNFSATTKAALAALTSGEVFAVYTQDTSVGCCPFNLCGANASNRDVSPDVSADSWACYAAAGSTTRRNAVFTAPNPGQICVYNVFSAPNDFGANFRQGGVTRTFTDATNTVAWTNSDAACLLVNPGATGQFVKGAFLEFMLFPRKLTTDQRAAVFTYLNHQWGV